MSLLITGTGTGVGKTVVTAGLAALLKQRGESFCVYKPIQTGAGPGAEDPDHIRSWAGEEVEAFCTYRFPEAVAPYAADPARTIQPHKILEEYKALCKTHKMVLVEGAGGVRVPIARHFEMLDLIRMFQLPVVVVTHPNLGTINHTLLTVDVLQAQRLEVKGVIISAYPGEEGADPAVKSLLPTLEAFLSVPVLGVLPVFDLRPGVMNEPSVLEDFERLGLWQMEAV